jgi:hypothetical protein
MTGPRKAVVFQPTVGGNGIVRWAGLQDLKALGVDEIIYIAVTPHAADVDVDTLMLDGEEQSKFPAITACYRLEIPHI